MEITNEQAEEKYQTATPAQKYLYASPDSGQRLQDLASKYDIKTPELYKIFAITVGDIVLGFYRIQDTTALLEQKLKISSPMAKLLGAEVLVFLKPLSEPNWQPPTTLNADNLKNNLVKSISSEIAETEESLKATSAVPTPTPVPTPTIPQPVETTYTSTQAAILTERPKPATENPGRWDTDK